MPATIIAAVGTHGINRPSDTRIVQELLNKNGRIIPPLRVDGVVGVKTIKAIEDFQRQTMRLNRPDGRVDPCGKTFLALLSRGNLAIQQAVMPSGNLSGAVWWNANQAKYLTSHKVQDLEMDFQKKVQEFISCLQAAGAKVRVSSTKRSKQRAYLMHYSWMIAKNNLELSKVPSELGVDIVWDHGDAQKSQKAAREMVDLFSIKYQPSLTSRHIEGKAIDMHITWTGTLEIRDKTGQINKLSAPCNGYDNIMLHKIGRTYGVIKLISDPPHWSTDGH
jgi:hypothetical protein